MRVELSDVKMEHHYRVKYPLPFEPQEVSRLLRRIEATEFRDELGLTVRFCGKGSEPDAWQVAFWAAEREALADFTHNVITPLVGEILLERKSRVKTGTAAA